MNGNFTLASAHQSVRDRIRLACEAAGRSPTEVALLAVSKTRTADEVAALAACGQHAMGENYLQEALDKQALLGNTPLEWHFIGPIQSNKTRKIAEHFQWVHSVENLRIARRLSDQRPDPLGPLNICLQVNVSGEDSKSGCAPDEAIGLAREMAALPRLRLRGLMAIPEPTEDVNLQRRRFGMLRELHAQIRQELARMDETEGSKARATFDTLSMGMSDDLEAAIAEGSTMVRVGTALFGPRPRKAASETP
ncbi:MAG: YggS family pyridoxal phosphate-dependent enzyme [Lautropia sp.]|nr:YggS family pyridoxal phosphate-dependent enzyme [Lautropia sp.]